MDTFEKRDLQKPRARTHEGEDHLTGTWKYVCTRVLKNAPNSFFVCGTGVPTGLGAN